MVEEKGKRILCISSDKIELNREENSEEYRSRYMPLAGLSNSTTRALQWPCKWHRDSL